MIFVRYCMYSMLFIPYPLRDWLVEIQRCFTLFADVLDENLRLHVESLAEK